MIDSTLEKMKKRVEQSRVTEEMHNISGQIFMGAIFPLVIRALGGVAIVWGVVLVLFAGLGGVLDPGSCLSEACLGRLSLCVFSSVTGILFLCAAAGAFAIGSTLAMFLSSQRKFQFSAIVSAGTLLTTSLFLFCRGAGILVVLLSSVIIFFSMFWGYSLWLKLGRS